MACNLTLSDELAERVGLKDEQGNVRKKITQAEFLSWLSQGNVTALLEEGLLDATKFANLREKLFTPKEALKAAEKATGKTKNLKQAIRESIRGAVKYVTKTVSAYNKELLQAEAAGAKEGAKFAKKEAREIAKEKAETRKEKLKQRLKIRRKKAAELRKERRKSKRGFINYLKDSFRDYIKNNPLPKIADPIKSNKIKNAINNRLNKILTQKSLANAILFYDKLLEDVNYIAKIDALRKAQNKVLRVNKDGLPYTDISFLQTIRQIVPEAVFNVEALTEALDAYANNLRGKAEQVLGIRNRLKEILAQEVELNKLAEAEIQKAKEQFYEGMYNEAVDTGIFSGTIQEYIQFIESPIVTEEALPTQKEPEQEKKERFVKEFIEFFDFLDSEMGLRDIVVGNAQTLTEREQLLKIYEALKNASEETLMNVPTLHLMKMQNILNNIVSEGDFTGFGDMIPQQIAQSEEARKMDWTKLRNIEANVRVFGRDIYKFGNRAKKGLQVLINSMVIGKNNAAKFTDLLLGRAQGDFANSQVKTAKVMSQLDRVLEKAKDAYKTAIRVDTIGFINQWLPDMTQEEIEAHVRERVERIADDFTINIETNTKKGSTRTQRALVAESVEGLNYLQDLGAITNLKIDLDAGTVSYDTVDTFVLDVDTLDADTKSVYGFVMDFFERYKDQVIKNIAIYTGRPAEAWVNYYPMVTYKSFYTQDTTTSSAQIFPTVNMYGGVPKQFGTTKKRTGLRGERQYARGLRQIFRYGVFQNIVMADMPYWKNYAYQSTLDSSPIYTYMKKVSKLPDSDISYLQKIVKNFVASKFAHASVTRDFEPVSKRLLSSLVQGFSRAIIQKPSQIWKQTVPAALYMYTKSGNYYFKAIKLKALGANNKLVKQATDLLIANAPESLRTLMGQLELSERQLEFEKIKSPTEQKVARNVEKAVDFVAEKQDVGITKWADAGTVKLGFVTGYIQNLFKSGKVKNDAELVQHFEDIALGKILPDQRSMVAASIYQTEVNNASDPDTAPEVMKSNKKDYFLRYISLTLNQAAIDSMRTAFDPNATREEVIEAVRDTVGYLAQAVAFRAVSFAGQEIIVRFLKEALLDMPDDDEEKEKRLQAGIWTNSALLIKDVFFGSSSIWRDFVVSTLLNSAVKYGIESEEKEFKEKYPKSKTKMLEWYDEDYTRLFGDPKLDDTPVGVMLSALEQTIKQVTKYSQNVDKYGQEGFNITPSQFAALQITPFILGLGALKEGTGWYLSAKTRPEDKKVAELSISKNVPSKDSKQALLQYAEIGINKFKDSYNEQGQRTRFGYNHFVFTPPVQATINGTDMEKYMQLAAYERLVLNAEQAKAWMTVNNKMRSFLEAKYAEVPAEQMIDDMVQLLDVKISKEFLEKIKDNASGAKDQYYDMIANKLIYNISMMNTEDAKSLLSDIGVEADTQKLQNGKVVKQKSIFTEQEILQISNIGAIKKIGKTE